MRSVTVVHELHEMATRQLEAQPVDLVVAYHPLLFAPAAHLVPGRGPAGRATRLLRAGVAVVVTHSDFDAMPGGMADAMADAVGLADVTGLAPVSGVDQVKVVTFVPAATVPAMVASLSAAGAGRIGDYEECAFTVEGIGRFLAGETTVPVTGHAGRRNTEAETRVEMVAPKSRVDAVVTALVAAHPYEEPAFDISPVAAYHRFGGRLGTFDGTWDDLLARVGQAFLPEGLRTARSSMNDPRRVAVSPGAGSSRIDAAVAAHSDVLVSGDIAHHRMADALDRGLSIIDPGHAATERPGMQRLRDLVAEICGDEVADERIRLDPG